MSHHLKVRFLGRSILHFPVAFWLLSALEHLQGPHHQRHIRCLSGVWSGTTLHRTSVQLSKPSDATHSGTIRPHLPGQLTIREELLGYHNTTATCKCECFFVVWLCQALEETSKKGMMELDQLMRYRDYWNQRLNQVVSANWRYRDRCRSDSSPVSISDSTSSEQGFCVTWHFSLVCCMFLSLVS